MTLAGLSNTTLAQVSAQTAKPRYDRSQAGIGILHFGPGAFHRAHQAVFVDDVLPQGGDWAISGVSLRNPDVRDALVPQDGLYTLAQLDEEIGYRIIGSIREVLCAKDEQAAVFARLANPATRIVSSTVTEKGYCLAGDDLDFKHADIIRDLGNPRDPVSVVGYIVEGFRLRRAAKLKPYTVVSCDNLVDNGHKLGRAVVQYAEALGDKDLARWIEAEAAFPSTMIDSITPATDDALRARAADAIGLRDTWPIQREAFTQWVIEDKFCNGRPDFASVGVQLTDDVGAFDRAKLRLLNGPHSTLAYLGSLLGLVTVNDAMREPALAAFLERLVTKSILPTVVPPKGFDLAAYSQAILKRFRNPAIRHLLAQIAWDGSQKLPFRLLGTVSDALLNGTPLDDLALPLAAWFHFLRGKARTGDKLTDPLADRLLAVAGAATGDATADVERFLALDNVFPPELAGEPAFRKALISAYAKLGDGSREAVLSALSR
ncbi:MAG: mannitol dehydrogenase family protein [Solimonas sp.]